MGDDSEWSPEELGDADGSGPSEGAGLSRGSGEDDGSGEFSCEGAGEVSPCSESGVSRAAPGTSAPPGVGSDSGLGLVSEWCPIPAMVEAARCVHTTGLGLPVAATAVTARRHVAPSASATGAMRHDRGAADADR